MVSVLVAAAILSLGGWRQAPLQADNSAHVSPPAETRIGTAVYQESGETVAKPR